MIMMKEKNLITEIKLIITEIKLITMVIKWKEYMIIITVRNLIFEMIEIIIIIAVLNNSMFAIMMVKLIQ